VSPPGNLGRLTGQRGPQRPVGAATRGTTFPNRLRRVDNWIVYALGDALRGAPDPLVVDLGYGETPVTTVELGARLAAVRRDVRVIGLEIDPERVAAASGVVDLPRLDFRHGGFELAGLRPMIVRALNVLRQYDEADVRGAWDTIAGNLAEGGVLIDGTCDELGRLCAWLTISAGPKPACPISLTLAASLSTLQRPAAFAERLPKALIHHNVAAERVHEFLRALDDAWAMAAPYSAFGVRQRFAMTVAAARDAGWPIRPEPRRWRLGELTVPWTAVAL